MSKKVSAEKKLETVIKATRAILEEETFEDTARAIFDFTREMTGAASGYVALLSDTGEENEVLFLEAGGMECTVDPELPMPIRGLRETAYKTHKPVYDNNFMDSKWVKFMPAGHVYLKNVMFAPLNIDGKTVGIMGLANKETDFTDEDAEIASVFGDIAAIALQNTRNKDLLNEKNKSLEQALKEIKTLHGIIPICAHCKKIRDDKGFWNRVEEYVTNHTEAKFSHGICPDCITKHFPEQAQEMLKKNEELK